MAFSIKKKNDTKLIDTVYIFIKGATGLLLLPYAVLSFT